MEATIQHKEDPPIGHQNPTRRRLGILDGLRSDAKKLRSIQNALRALALAHEAGSIHPLLAGLKTRAHVEEVLARYYRRAALYQWSQREMLQGEVPEEFKQDQERLRRAPLDPDGELIRLDDAKDLEAALRVARALAKAGRGSRGTVEDLMHSQRLREAGLDTEATWAQAKRELESLLTPVPTLTLTQQKIRDLERDLFGMKIPGYFPTPPPVVEQLLERACIQPGDRVLEPSAGKGNIAEAIRETHPMALLSVIELQGRLREILTLKGFNLLPDGDFLEHAPGEVYDRIVMNPPFEKGQDIDHVQHAYELLSPGGIVVSVMSEGPFFRSDRKASNFRDWLDRLDSESERLPPQSFAKSENSTDVATRILVITKPS